MARMGINTTGVVTFTAAAALTQYQRVKLVGETVDVAGADEAHIGYADAPAASGALVAVRLRNAEGTRLAIASAAIVAGAALEGTAAGAVATASAGTPIGYALQAAGAAGDVIGILDNNG